MKPNKTYLITAISSVALLTVIIIQVSWILNTAKIKEELFNEKANMVLSKTAEVFASKKFTDSRFESDITEYEKQLMDSLFGYYMHQYNIRIDYHFEIKPTSINSNFRNGFVSNNYSDPSGGFSTCIADEPGNKAWELKLVFPDKKQYILAEMGLPFISSIILILVVIVMLWRTISSLTKEKKISEHTADFLNNMTHEFKTPLTNISLAGKMMVKEPNIHQKEKIKHYSGIILEENEKLRHQVEQVLSMSALEKGEIPIRKTIIDIHEIVGDAIKYMGIQIENTQGNLMLELQANQSLVSADKTHLTNTLCNLIDNAIKYSKKSPEITIRTYNSENQVIIEVSDKGIGIDKHYKKEIFNHFFRIPTGDVHNVKGFGLGLSYVKKMVQLHTGNIICKSEKGKGTTFIITLPNA